MTPYSGNPGDPDQLLLPPRHPGRRCLRRVPRRAPFAPSFAAAPKSNQAGAYSPLKVHIARANGQQELKAATVALAPGMIGKLAGIPYCPASALAAAAGPAAPPRRPNSSCPAKSEVGTATVQAGTAATPLSITGKVFLSGPYHGAPLSLAVVTPRHGRAVRPRHGRGAGGAPRQPGNGAGDARSPTRSPTSSAAPSSASGRSSLDLSQGIHPEPDQLRQAGLDGDAERRRRQPGLAGGLELASASVPFQTSNCGALTSGRS